MIVRTLLAALLAGILAGVLVTPVQYAKVVPLILHAETYENGGAEPHEHHAAASALVAPAFAETAGEEEASTTLVESRLGGTILADIVIGAALALLLTAASLFSGVPVTAGNGALWGLAGFAVVSLAPALGLPPELPAMPAAELGARQLWWCATVALAAFALAALVLARAPWMKALGVLALLLPHLVGAPHPADLASPVPPTLAAEFAVASLATSALLWLLVGVLVGLASDRLRRTDALGAA